MTIHTNTAGTGNMNKPHIHFDGTRILGLHTSLLIDMGLQTAILNKDCSGVVDIIEEIIRTELAIHGHQAPDYRLVWGPVYGTMADKQDIHMEVAE